MNNKKVQTTGQQSNDFDKSEDLDGLTIFNLDHFLKIEATYNSENKIVPGYCNPEEAYGASCCAYQPICNIYLPSIIQKANGYKFATKVINMDYFVDMFGWIGYEDQLRPYEMLHNLEKAVTENWQKRGIVASNYDLDYLNDKCVEFSFSHFEISDDDFGDRYLCVFACYEYVGTVK